MRRLSAACGWTGVAFCPDTLCWLVSVVFAPLTTTRRIGGCLAKSCLPLSHWDSSETARMLVRLLYLLTLRRWRGLFSNSRFVIGNSVNTTKLFLHGITRIRRRSAKNLKNISSVSMQSWNPARRALIVVLTSSYSVRRRIASAKGHDETCS
jgi:hypothetical protein